MSRSKYFVLFEFCGFCTAAQFTTEQRGQKFASDLSYSLFFKQNGDYLSPWHDIPLYSEEDPTNQTVNMIVEIPRFTRAKFEIHREAALNPIRQDVKEGKLRYLPNIFPWKGHVCNYGAFPQTWENPYHRDQWTNLRGDKDPLDVCEVGTRSVASGTVLPVRVLGVLAMIDSDETDWKVIVMDAVEAKNEGINSMEDLAAKRPGLAEAVRLFFRVYKVPSGKGENRFAYNGEYKDRKLAMDVIRFLHTEWKEMTNNCSIGSIGQEFGFFNSKNTKRVGSPCRISQQEARKEVEKQPTTNPSDAPKPPNLEDWHFLQTSKSTSDNSGDSHDGHFPLWALLLFLPV